MFIAREALSETSQSRCRGGNDFAKVMCGQRCFYKHFVPNGTKKSRHFILHPSAFILCLGCERYHFLRRILHTVRNREVQT